MPCGCGGTTLRAMKKKSPNRKPAVGLIDEVPKLPSLTRERAAEAAERSAVLRRAMEPVLQQLVTAEQRRALEQARAEDFAKAQEGSRQRLRKLRAAQAEVVAKRPSVLERIQMATRPSTGKRRAR